jgi:polyisoprenoid-binding protein YceI
MTDTTSSHSAGTRAAAALLASSGVGQWVLDSSQSSVRINHKTMWGLVTVRGRFTEVSGAGEIRPDGTATGALDVAASSVDTSHKKRDEHLRSADFFDVATHPTITFAAHKVSLEPTGLSITGTLTVRGITRPLSLTGSLLDATSDAVTVESGAVVDRSLFSMGWNRLGMLTGPATVSVVARFTRQPG